MSNDWENIQEYDRRQMEKYYIGAKVRLTFNGGKLTGVISEHQKPENGLSPRYKVKLDDGQETGFLYQSCLMLI